MSSHHFVKEGQEPALLVIGDTDFSAVEGLLEWAPTILIVDSMVEKALSWGIRIDTVFASGEDYGTIQKGFAGEQVVDIVTLPREKDVVEAATDYLLRDHQNYVSIVVESFSDYRTAVESQLARISITVIDNEFRWFPLRKTLLKWVGEGSAYRIITSGDSVFETNGLRCDSGQYIAESDGLMTISPQGLIWVGESYKK